MNGEKMIEIESVARHVADLSAAAAFYETLGFVPEQDSAPAWAKEPSARLRDTTGLECRELTLTLPSAVSDRQFPLHLREYRGIERRDWTSLDPWSVGTGHLGLGVEDPYRTWDELAAAGHLRSHTRGNRPIPMPDDLRSEQEHHIERPFAAFMDPDGLLIEIQPQRRAHPATPNWVELGDERPGFSHLNLNVPNMDRAERFFSALGVEFPAGPYEFFTHPWLSQVFDTPPNDSGWKIVYGRLPEAHTDSAMMPLEFIEFASFGNDSGYGAARMSDINVTVLGLRVRGIERLYASLIKAGASTYSDGVVTVDDGARAAVVRAPETHAFLELRDFGE
jgi:catechol 2,3-dioxygenase-like lactoylglutathione lyase family enzyme